MTQCLPRGAAREHGFALLIVLWSLVLIAFLVAHISATARTEVQIASNLKAYAVAQAGADGAIYEAIFYLSDPRPERRWPLGSDAHEIQIGASRVTVRVEDEGGRINPSLASPALVQALLRVLLNDPERAAALADAIAEWVGATIPARAPSAILAEYRAAGLDYGPPGAPLESIDELARVRGMTPQALAMLGPHLTLFGPPTPERASADAAVAAAVALVGEAAPLATSVAPNSMLVRIHAAAQGPANALVRRMAVVRIEPASAKPYILLSWANDDD
jgi:general secretion pathway protein K